jgi:hypothetical protein
MAAGQACCHLSRLLQQNLLPSLVVRTNDDGLPHRRATVEEAARVKAPFSRPAELGEEASLPRTVSPLGLVAPVSTRCETEATSGLPLLDRARDHKHPPGLNGGGQLIRGFAIKVQSLVKFSRASAITYDPR